MGWLYLPPNPLYKMPEGFHNDRQVNKEIKKQEKKEQELPVNKQVQEPKNDVPKSNRLGNRGRSGKR